MKFSRSVLLFMSMVFCALVSNAQTPTWSEDIAPMIYDNCSHCHHEGQVAPFPLMGYEDAVSNALSMYTALFTEHMPPWPADPDYRHFVGETIVTDEQIAEFLEWLEGGMPFGDPELEPDPPVFEDDGTLLEHVDFVAAIEPYTLQSDNEEYRWFVIPTNFSETKYIQGIEVVAGLEDYVHHADIYVDVTGQSALLDANDPLPGFNSTTGWPSTTTYLNAWQPGAGPARYPDNWGFELPVGADLVIEIHFGPGGAEEIDDTVMNLEFVEDPASVRPISVGWLVGSGAMTDGPLVIPPNEISTFHQEAVPWWSDKSIISICPHMHLLGDSYKVWMETPSGDSIPLCDIPEWQFHWQFYYMFQQPQFAPGGSIIKTIATYDNTVMNDLNPNYPPITVFDGGLTTDEMILVYFIYADYQEGDEDIILDPDLMTSVEPSPEVGFKLYPNPALDELSLELPLDWETASLRILDTRGLVVKAMDGLSVRDRISVDDLSAGTYNLEVLSNQGSLVRPFVKR